MITVAQYLQRVRESAKAVDANEYTVDNAVELLGICWDLDRTKVWLDEKRELYDMKPADHPMFIKMPGNALFYELGEAKAAIENDDLMDSWVYDRTTGIVILNMNRGAHESFTAGLFGLYKGTVDFKARWQIEDESERFLTEGLGFFLSSALYRPLKGANTRLTAQEKRVFQNQQFMDL